MKELSMYFTFVYSMVNLLLLIMVITAYAAAVCKHNQKPHNAAGRRSGGPQPHKGAGGQGAVLKVSSEDRRLADKQLK